MHELGLFGQVGSRAQTAGKRSGDTPSLCFLHQKAPQRLCRAAEGVQGDVKAEACQRASLARMWGNHSRLPSRGRPRRAQCYKKPQTQGSVQRDGERVGLADKETDARALPFQTGSPFRREGFTHLCLRSVLCWVLSVLASFSEVRVHITKFSAHL